MDFDTRPFRNPLVSVCILYIVFVCSLHISCPMSKTRNKGKALIVTLYVLITVLLISILRTYARSLIYLYNRTPIETKLSENKQST